VKVVQTVAVGKCDPAWAELSSCEP